MTKDELRAKANELPLLPGVYLMMDKTGQVIYVGKAKKLKNRVSQYFQDTASHNGKTRRMVSQVDRFDTIIVRSEFEALILENSLIKRHMPRYNILLKDDKGYPFVRLDEASEYPRFSLVTRPAQDGARYFGPFGGRSETRQAIDAVCAALRLPPPVPAGYRQGTPLPESPHRPVRRLLPSRRPGRRRVPPPHRSGCAAVRGTAAAGDGGAHSPDERCRRGAGL